ncbi:hypothetical protein [Chryseolinea lacunae]|uniref:Lipoprotein n=1 Tax=Chryseolinea lacunae TaxID=2801331 RepID=A0ABS1KMJ4_9BACT|nr:hypothetical protein [Chryseolinea lacunae]MBL0740656.1 hypothetical protein [Chryseolinea lacunae]
MTDRLAISFIFFILAVSCSSVPKTSYQDNGLNFKITPDFRLGRTDTYKKNQATYIPFYGRDKKVYAKFSVVWIPCRSDLDWEVQNYVDGLNSIYKSDAQNKPEYSEVRSTKFGSHDARQIDYVVANDGPRVGSYTVFYCDNLTVIIGQHSTVEGQAMAQNCRATIESTYSCPHSVQH